MAHVFAVVAAIAFVDSLNPSTIGPALVLAPTLLRLGRTSPEGIVARAVGGAETVYSNLTDYELSMKNVVPMKAHLILDAVGGATLAIGAFEVGMAAFTKTEPPKAKPRGSAQLAQLVSTAKRAKKAASGAVKSVA